MSRQPHPGFEPAAALTLYTCALRSSTDADRVFERRLFETARPDAALLAVWPDDVRKPFLDQQFHFQTDHYARTYPRADWLLIVKDSEPIGRIILDRAVEEWRLVDIALLPTWRGNGIGTELLQTLLADAGSMRARCVRLTVGVNSPARRLYERIGFEADGSGDELNLGMIWQPA